MLQRFEGQESRGDEVVVAAFLVLGSRVPGGGEVKRLDSDFRVVASHLGELRSEVVFLGSSRRWNHAVKEISFTLIWKTSSRSVARAPILSPVEQVERLALPARPSRSAEVGVGTARHDP